MKKLLRIAVVLGMVLCLSVSAFASSISGAHLGKVVDTATGQELEYTVSDSTVSLSAEEAVTAIGDAGVTAGNVLCKVWDVHAEIPAGGSVTITFEVPEAKGGLNVYVLHYNGSSWEKVGEGKGETVEATFTSLSPVAIVVETPSEAQPTEPAPSEPGSGEPTSPKTGEEPVLLVAGTIALFAGAVAVVVLKKKKEM